MSRKFLTTELHLFYRFVDMQTGEIKLTGDKKIWTLDSVDLQFLCDFLHNMLSNTEDCELTLRLRATKSELKLFGDVF